MPKAARACACLQAAGLLDALTFVSPNEEEAAAMAAALDGSTYTAGTDAAANAAAAATALVRAGCRHVFVTRGARGLIWAWGSGGGEVAVEELEAISLGQVLVSTRCAGDAFVAGAVSRLLPPLGVHRPLEGMPLEGLPLADVREALQAGLRAARMALLEEAAVPSQLRPGVLA